MENSTPQNLPATSWDEDAFLKVPSSAVRLPRWGSVQQACAVLDDCNREVVYDLIAIGSVAGYKRRPEAKNSHWRVDLLSVWNHKQRQMGHKGDQR